MTQGKGMVYNYAGSIDNIVLSAFSYVVPKITLFL